jgi:hypothetical protein
MRREIVAVLVGLCFSTLGCKKEPIAIESHMAVSKAFKVEMDGSGPRLLEAGEYPATLNVNANRVKITLKDDQQHQVSFRLKLPKGLQIPTNGEIMLSPEQSGQPFETRVGITTNLTKSETRREYESCTIQETEFYCSVVGNPPQNVCQPVYRTRWGSKPVEYYMETTDRKIETTLHQNGEEVAQMEGSRRDREAVYTFQGLCF